LALAPFGKQPGKIRILAQTRQQVQGCRPPADQKLLGFILDHGNDSLLTQGNTFRDPQPAWRLADAYCRECLRDSSPKIGAPRRK